MIIPLEESWKQQLEEEFHKDYFLKLMTFLKERQQKASVFPVFTDIFSAFHYCSFPATKVVILGQDPYHGPGQAHGLSFSVRDNVPIPPSLSTIFKEISQDLSLPIPTTGNLRKWAMQGVLLLNAILTVEAGVAGSHRGRGWEKFTDAVIDKLNQNKTDVVFMLWGSYAQRKGSFIDRSRHLVLEAPHPSPLSSYRGFYGCKHFSQCNKYLLERNYTPIRW
jgi:uracil-DNA glycosylase